MPKTDLTKRQLLKEIEGLSSEKVRLLPDLAAFLKEREEWEATLEVLANKELANAIELSRKAWREGRREEFVPFAP